MGRDFMGLSGKREGERRGRGIKNKNREGERKKGNGKLLSEGVCRRGITG